MITWYDVLAYSEQKLTKYKLAHKPHCITNFYLYFHVKSSHQQGVLTTTGPVDIQDVQASTSAPYLTEDPKSAILWVSGRRVYDQSFQQRASIRHYTYTYPTSEDNDNRCFSSSTSRGPSETIFVSHWSQLGRET